MDEVYRSCVVLRYNQQSIQTRPKLQLETHYLTENNAQLQAVVISNETTAKIKLSLWMKRSIGVYGYPNKIIQW